MLRAIDRIAEQLQRSQTLIDMAVKSVPETRPEHCATDLVMAMRSSCRLLDELFENSGVLIEPLHADLSARVALGRIEAEQVFVNVMRNAIDSIQSRRKQGWTGTGRVVIEFDVDRTGVRCVIADNGAGLCASMTEAGFRPLHTTKAAEGTGIGLFICEKMLSAAGGSIRLLPGLTEGAEVEIRLPLLDEG
jgi:C4-dicarboxylate-specific signal transduction histidine kinase